VNGAFGLVDALRDCLSSWRRRTVMKPFLNVFREFNEIDFRNSRFGFNHDPVRSTRPTVAFLYSLPLVVLKSSASARDADSAKIDSAVFQYFTRAAILPLLLSTQQ
jgi:hypothetical protein